MQRLLLTSLHDSLKTAVLLSDFVQPAEHKHWDFPGSSRQYFFFKGRDIRLLDSVKSTSTSLLSTLLLAVIAHHIHQLTS